MVERGGVEPQRHNWQGMLQDRPRSPRVPPIILYHIFVLLKKELPFGSLEVRAGVFLATYLANI